MQASGSDKKPAEGSEDKVKANVQDSSESVVDTKPADGVLGPLSRDLGTPVPDLLIGTRLSNEYEIVELIGTGGWSRVYRATQSSSDDHVAVKVLHSHLLFDQESVSRFEREARSGASLSHPNICRIFDYNRLKTGQPYIVMEYLQGESLSSILRRKGKLSAEEAVPIFSACCRGLEAAHNQGIVHRDVKPANIFLINGEQERKIKLLDFGMAKIIIGGHPDLTQTGTAFGTVQYMSPEQALGETIDGRSDLYALGCVMYEALTGKKIFDGRTAFSVMDQHVRSVPRKFKEADPISNVSPALEALVMKTLSKSADRRFQTAGELVSNLESLTELSTAENADSNKSAHLWWIGGLALLAALILSLSSH